MRKSVPAALLAALALAASPAMAADNGIYLGASIGASGVEDDELDFDGDATGYKVIAGWRFLDWLAVEGNYVDFGSADDTVLGERVEADVDGLSLSAVLFVPLGPVDLFGRVGAVDWNADVSSVVSVTTAPTSRTVWGLSSASGAWACARSTSASNSVTRTST